MALTPEDRKLLFKFWREHEDLLSILFEAEKDNPEQPEETRKACAGVASAVAPFRFLKPLDTQLEAAGLDGNWKRSPGMGCRELSLKPFSEFLRARKTENPALKLNRLIFYIGRNPKKPGEAYMTLQFVGGGQKDCQDQRLDWCLDSLRQYPPLQAKAQELCGGENGGLNLYTWKFRYPEDADDRMAGQAAACARIIKDLAPVVERWWTDVAAKQANI